jgi:hypothetical protein
VVNNAGAVTRHSCAIPTDSWRPQPGAVPRRRSGRHRGAPRPGESSRHPWRDGEGSLAKTWRAQDVPAEIAALSTHVFEHERLPFVSYPSEWSPLMLCDAALLTLEMQKLALGAGLILKDAAPTNIVFRGSRPVFVDFLSFVERERGEYLWRARHQFDACFLLPLLLSIEAGVPIAWMLRDFLHGSRTSRRSACSASRAG